MFKIGCDPEIFVRNGSGVRSIIGLMGGTKKSPMPLSLLGDGFGVQEDNVAMEFTIPPADTRDAFISNVSRCRNFLAQAVKDMHGLELDNRSAVSFPDSELVHPASHVFGCDPDFNAWTGKMNHKPTATDKNLRSAGGHVHIGVGRITRNMQRSIIQRCDLFLGVPSVLMDEGELRKQLYGKAGAFRPKSYGAEYRTLSNFWVFDDKLIGWVHDQVAKVITSDVIPDGERVQRAINDNDKGLASELISEYNLELA